MNEISEIQLEDFLYQNPEALRNPCFRITKWLARQFRVPSGIIDLLGITDSRLLVVVELKSGRIKSSTIGQMSRYAYDIQNILDMINGGVHNVIKIAIGSGGIDERIIFEAEAALSWIYTYEVKDTDINFFYWGLDTKYREEVQRKYDRLSYLDIFADFVVPEYSKYARPSELYKTLEEIRYGGL